MLPLWRGGNLKLSHRRLCPPTIPLRPHPLLALYFPRRAQGPAAERTTSVKWLYHGEARADRASLPPLHLKAEWQAAEAIKIEPLSPAARALLIGGRVGWGGLAHSHSQTGAPVCPVCAACVDAPSVHLHLKEERVALSRVVSQRILRRTPQPSPEQRINSTRYRAEALLPLRGVSAAHWAP